MDNKPYHFEEIGSDLLQVWYAGEIVDLDIHTDWVAELDKLPFVTYCFHTAYDPTEVEHNTYPHCLFVFTTNFEEAKKSIDAIYYAVVLTQE